MPDAPVATRPWRDHWPALLLGTLAAVLALWARHVIFPALSWNRDEPVYLWQVEMLRAGRLTVPDGGHPELFRPWLSAAVDGEMFTQYTLGWPLALLAATVLTGSATAALMVGASLAVVGTYALGLELFGDRRIATLGAALMVASPIVPIQGGAHLSYLFTLGLGLIFGSLLLNGIRTERTSRLLIAGVLLGYIFMTRPYDALLWGSAFGVYALIRSRSSRWREAIRPVLIVGVASLPLVVATLTYNHHITGSWSGFPITTVEPIDTFGFGPRRLMPVSPVTDYQLPGALWATAKNAFVLPWFLVGGYLGIGVAAAGLWQRRRDPTTLALVLIAAAFPIGYFMFWGNQLSSMVSRISGPIYFVPLYAPICLLMASAMVEWWPRQPRRTIIAGAALLLATVPGAATRMVVNHDISVGQKGWRTSVAQIERRALVFVADTGPYLLLANPFSANAPDLDGRILYAAENGPTMLDLLAAHADRPAFLQQASIPSQAHGPSEHPAQPAVTLTKVDVRRGGRVELAIRAASTADRSNQDLHIEVGDLSATPTPLTGSGDVTVTLAPVGTDADLHLAERGHITITLSGDDRSERITFVYRVSAGEVEVMLPAARELRVPAHPGEWRRVPSLSRLAVAVTVR